jgi:predicted metal-dependent hydrolase
VVSRCEAKTNLYANEYKIKNMRTKWGTCNIDKKRIWINLQLAKKPSNVLSIGIHELVHLIERITPIDFMLLLRSLPTWKEARKLLAELP